MYVGYFFGSLFSGEIADKFGRRVPIIIASLIMFIVALVGAFMPTFVLYLIFVNIIVI